jgi:hypothetical protein
LAKLKARDVDIFIGAHPGQNDTLVKRERITAAENPFIDRNAWPAFLARLEVGAASLFE